MLMRRLKLVGIVGVVCAVSALIASFAFAAETIGEYKAEVEPICKENADANKRILAGARTEVKEGKLKAVAAQFAKAATALARTSKELEDVPKPAGEEARLLKWLSYAKVESELLRKVAKALKAGQANQAQAFVVKLTHTANLANSQIVVFGFHYCKIEPSQFT
jgi:hypothetical protein